MVIDLICKNNSNELCDTSKNKVTLRNYADFGVLQMLIDHSFEHTRCYIANYKQFQICLAKTYSA